MKRLEGSPRHTKAPIPESAKKAFLDAQQHHPHDFVKQAELVVTSHRPAGLPEKFQPLLMADNNTRDPLDFFRQYPIERQRQQQEAAARERARQQQEELAKQQRRGREENIARDAVQELKQDMEDDKIDQFGSEIKRMWETALSIPVSLSSISLAAATEKNDSAVVQRSQVGMRLAYTYAKDVPIYHEVDHGVEDRPLYRWEQYGTEEITLTNALSFGIGYFTDRSQIAPEAQSSVSDEDLQKGVKSYFIQETYYSDELVGTAPSREYAKKSTMSVFPQQYPESHQVFGEQLYESMEALSSKNIRPIRTIVEVQQPSPLDVQRSSPVNRHAHRISRRKVLIGLGAVGLTVAGYELIPPAYGLLTHTNDILHNFFRNREIYTYQHATSVHAVAWSPNGEYIASGDANAKVQVREAATGNRLLEYAGNMSDVRSVAWSPDGTKIASGGKVWDATNGNDISNISDPNSISWSPDGKYIVVDTGATNDTIEVWEVATGNRIIKYNTDTITSVAWSPDGKYIASGSLSKGVQIVDSDTGNRIADYSVTVDSVSWSPDSKYIASGNYDHTIEVWEAITGNRRIVYSGHSDQITSASWSPDGKYIASGSYDQTAQVWEAATGNRIIEYRGHSNVVTSVSWSPDGKKIVSGSDDGTVQVWDATIS